MAIKPPGSVIHIGATGSREGMTKDQRSDLRAFLREIRDESKGSEIFFHHGDCQGSDVQGAEIAFDLGYFTIAHPPLVETYRGFHNSHLILPQKEFLERNRDIVHASDEMFAFPKSMDDEKTGRGGTWYTVRYAREHKVPIAVIEP